MTSSIPSSAAAGVTGLAAAVVSLSPGAVTASCWALVSLSARVSPARLSRPSPDRSTGDTAAHVYQETRSLSRLVAAEQSDVTHTPPSLLPPTEPDHYMYMYMYVAFYTVMYEALYC